MAGQSVKEPEYDPEDCASTLHAVRVILGVESGRSIVQRAQEVMEVFNNYHNTKNEATDASHG